MVSPPKVLLVSGSPRRLALLRAIGWEVEVRRPDVDEIWPGGPVNEGSIALAERKLQSIERHNDQLALAADTLVVLGDRILGKPKSPGDARITLSALSGREHRVVTGFVVAKGHSVRRKVVSTKVTFRELTDREIDLYVDSGEPLDKAGAYGIQGLGGALVDHLRGSYTNVVGLPLSEVLEALQSLS